MIEKKKVSNLGQYVRDWREGMKVDNEELIQFTLQENIDLNTIISKKEIQSLVSKFIHSSSKKNENKKEKKEKKDVQEIDDTPPEEEDEQEKAHGGEEDQHQDVEDAEDVENQSDGSQNKSKSKSKQNQDNKNNNSDKSNLNSQNNSSNQSENQNSNSKDTKNKSDSLPKIKDENNIQNSSEGKSNIQSKQQGESLEQKAKQIAQENKKNNETLKKQLEQLKEKYGDIDNENKKSDITLSQNTSRKIGYGGGGSRMDDAKNPDLATFRAIQDFLIRLASDDAPVGKVEGKDKWDPTKIIKSRFNADFINAKFSRPKERNIWFIIDDSGSVSQFAEFIMSMIQGGSNIVKVVHGSEAKPCNLLSLPKVNSPKVLGLRDLQQFTTWEQEFNHSFIVCLETFIKECGVRSGDVLVFWGDLMDALESSYDTPEMFRRILRSYKCYWLLSHDGSSDYYGNHTEIIENSKAFKMFYNINNAQALRKTIQKIK